MCLWQFIRIQTDSCVYVYVYKFWPVVSKLNFLFVILFLIGRVTSAKGCVFDIARYSEFQTCSQWQPKHTEYIYINTHTHGGIRLACTRCTLGSTEIISRRIEKLMNFESATNTFAWKHVHKYLYTGRRKGLCKRKDNGSNRSEFDGEWKKTATKQMTSFLLRSYENGNKNGSVTVEMQQQQSIAFGERGATCEWNRFEGIHPKFMFMRNEHFVGFAFNKMPFAFIRLLSFDSMLCSDGDCRN